jgi:predicted polyphosphate/ATP-dependent NAD kinase
MSDGTIKIPTWALPIGAAALSGVMVWGASQAQAQATQEEVDRIEAAVVDVVEEQQATGKLAAVNASKIEAIVDSLAEQSETAKASDAKLQQLIEIMLKQN